MSDQGSGDTGRTEREAALWTARQAYLVYGSVNVTALQAACEAYVRALAPEPSGLCPNDAHFWSVIRGPKDQQITRCALCGVAAFDCEWYAKMARLEAGQDISAGAPEPSGVPQGREILPACSQHTLDQMGMGATTEPTVEQRAEWEALAAHLACESGRMASWIGPGTISLNLKSRDLRDAALAISDLLAALERAEASRTQNASPTASGPPLGEPPTRAEWIEPTTTPES